MLEQLRPRGPDYLEAALLSASALDDWRIRLAWRDTDNNLQVHIEQGRGEAGCENCSPMFTWLKNIRKKPHYIAMFLSHLLLQMLDIGPLKNPLAYHAAGVHIHY